MIAETGGVLDGFGVDVKDLVSHRLEPATDAEIFAVIERVVKARAYVADELRLALPAGRSFRLRELAKT